MSQSNVVWFKVVCGVLILLLLFFVHKYVFVGNRSSTRNWILCCQYDGWTIASFSFSGTLHLHVMEHYVRFWFVSSSLKKMAFGTQKFAPVWGESHRWTVSLPWQLNEAVLLCVSHSASELRVFWCFVRGLPERRSRRWSKSRPNIMRLSSCKASASSSSSPSLTSPAHIILIHTNTTRRLFSWCAWVKCTRDDLTTADYTGQEFRHKVHFIVLVFILKSESQS